MVIPRPPINKAGGEIDAVAGRSECVEPAAPGTSARSRAPGAQTGVPALGDSLGQAVRFHLQLSCGPARVTEGLPRPGPPLLCQPRGRPSAGPSSWPGDGSLEAWRWRCCFLLDRKGLSASGCSLPTTACQSTLLHPRQTSEAMQLQIPGTKKPSGNTGGGGDFNKD